MARPWDNAKKYFGTANAALAGEDGDRIRAYRVYEDFYWNSDDTFKLVQRGEDNIPIYLPSTKRIIETIHRFLAVNYNYMIDPLFGDKEQHSAVDLLLRRIFKREQVYAKFTTQKRYGLIRGDAFWHITANPDKAETERISIHELDPGLVFVIEDDENKVIGYHIVDVVPNPVDKNVNAHRRQTYRKTENGIESSLNIFTLNKWDDRSEEPAELIKKITETALPREIDQLPIYHIRNQRENFRWGSSAARGIETVIAAINQGVSDQDLTLAIQGLGIYWTDSGPAVDEEGNPTTVDMGPARIVEVAPGAKFDRVSGVSGGLPGIEHMKFMQESIDQGIGIPAVASGRVDVTIAESGIALYLQMAPLLSSNAEKEQEMLGVMDQMLYDIVHKWFPAYEGLNAPEVEVVSVVGDPMPRNREAEIKETIDLLLANLITRSMAITRLTKFGYEFPDNALEQLEKQATIADPFVDRVEEEIDAIPSNS